LTQWRALPPPYIAPEARRPAAFANNGCEQLQQLQIDHQLKAIGCSNGSSADATLFEPLHLERVTQATGCDNAL